MTKEAVVAHRAARAEEAATALVAKEAVVAHHAARAEELELVVAKEAVVTAGNQRVSKISISVCIQR